MEYNALIDSVRVHLDRLRVACNIDAGKPVTEKALAKAERQMSIRLPAQLREFYQAIGNGFSFDWSADPDSSNSPFGGLTVPKLSHLSEWYIGWQRGALYSPEEGERYGFPYTDDPALAKITAAKMWHWLPVIQEGNGDQLCIDLGDPSCPVVFDQHDWLDGGTGENGHVLASNWANFLTDWASVCFQRPKSLYWPNCFRSDGGISWNGDQFRSPFRIDGMAKTA